MTDLEAPSYGPFPYAEVRAWGQVQEVSLALPLYREGDGPLIGGHILKGSGYLPPWAGGWLFQTGGMPGVLSLSLYNHRESRSVGTILVLWGDNPTGEAEALRSVGLDDGHAPPNRPLVLAVLDDTSPIDPHKVSRKLPSFWEAAWQLRDWYESGQWRGWWEQPPAPRTLEAFELRQTSPEQEQKLDQLKNGISALLALISGER